MSEDRYIGAIEDIVGEAKFVDGARTVFERLASNAPVFCPERRRFLETAAMAAAGAWMGMAFPSEAKASNSSYQPPGPPVTDFNGKQYSGWQAYLLGQDLIFGPSLLLHPGNGRYNDFQNHIRMDEEYLRLGAVDYLTPIGTPIVPIRYGVANFFTDHNRSKAIEIEHPVKTGRSLRSIYHHLDGYTKEAVITTDWDINQKENSFNLMQVIGYTGNTGKDPFTRSYGLSIPHLHFAIQKREPKKTTGSPYHIVLEWGKWEAPGLDPFKHGIDGGRLIYHDGETILRKEMTDFYVVRQMAKLDEVLRTTNNDELGLDDRTKTELQRRLSDFGALQNYLRYQVLQKHPNQDGGMNYQFSPGSFMYSLAIRFIRQPDQEFLATLPFVSPLVVDTYREANPGIEL